MIECKKVDALKARLFSENKTVFAILDGASVPDLPHTLASLERDYVCLLRGELEPDVAEVAPYLAILEEDSPLTDWVLTNGWGQHWGIFGKAEGDLFVLRKHFRTFVKVNDDRGKSLYFRYYDPRILRVYLPTCDTCDLELVFGPVTSYLVEGQDISTCNIFSFDCSTLNKEKVALGEFMLNITAQQSEQIPRFIVDENAETTVAATKRITSEPINGRFLVVRTGEAPSLGDRIFAEKMGAFLTDTFPNSVEVPPDELSETIMQLAQRAAYYKLTLEHQVAAFIFAAWIMGKDFDVAFQSAQAVLTDLDVSSDMKAEWLWKFVETAADILEKDSR